jgi:signal transduction histidine kinase
MAFRHAMGTKHRNRLRYLGIVLLAFAIGDLLILIGNIPRIHTGLALRLIGFTIATIAVLRHDLPDIRRLTQATLRVGLLSAVTAGLYLAGLIVAGSASGIIPHLPSPTTAGVAVGLVLLFVALIDVTLTPRLRRILDRTMLGEGYDAQKALRAHSQQIHLILDPERLADTTLDWLNTHLRTRHAAFILFTPQRHGRTQLRILRSTSAPVPGPQSFGSDSRFIAHFHNIGRPLSQYDLDMLSWFQSMPAAEQRWLKALAVDLYVPILGTNKCVAMLALGPKASQQPFSESDLEILMILADQTSTALENARLLGDLRAVQVDLNRLSTELAETNRQLKRLDRTKTDFITIASHELRTPLTQISGYSEILAQLKSEELGDTHLVHDFVDGIARGAQRLRQVVDAMVDVSLIETQSLTLDLEPQSVDAIMDSALEAIGPMVTARRQTLKLGDLSLLPRVLADGARLRQVFVSLLSNAVKFTPDGGQITLSGRTVPSDEDERIVELLVTDNGIGIDRDHQDLIFEKFYRPEHLLAHSTDTSRFKGAGPGLGLAIARGIVEAHGGRIWVESPQRDERACPGSTFYVQLPAGGPGED